MRILFPAASLVIAAFSLALDSQTADPALRLCRFGFCRFDQLFASVDAQGMTPSSLRALLTEDPSNPLVWCTYAEALASRGGTKPAAAAFDRAIALGPGMPPVLMRAANFDFAHSRTAHGFAMANRILRQTDAFDQVLFSYLTQTNLPAPGVLGTAIPPTPRAAQSWLAWLSIYGSEEDLLATWSWMKQHQLRGEKSAVDLAWALWRRKSFAAAQAMWADWLGPGHRDYLDPQRLANVRFAEQPGGSPFDWTLEHPPSVHLSRNNGLKIRFSGTENVDFSQIRQFVTVSSGRYRFSAEIRADGLTTDQRPFFRVFDPVNPDRIDVRTPAVERSVARSWITLDFHVPPGTEALRVQLERRPSTHFDSKIEGTLHIYRVSLEPLR